MSKDDEEYFTDEEKQLFRKLEENSDKQEKLVKMMGTERDEREFDNLMSSFHRLSEEMDGMIKVLGDKIKEDIDEIKRLREDEEDGEGWKKND